MHVMVTVAAAEIVVGVPEITPDAASIDKPAGNEVALKVNGREPSASNAIGVMGWPSAKLKMLAGARKLDGGSRA